MKTTDLLYQNQKVLNALQELLLQSKKHVDFFGGKCARNPCKFGKHRRKPANGRWYFGKSNRV